MTIERRLELSQRHIWNAIHEMIQEDPVKALVELITNADDSYARLAASGRPADGRILVEVEEHRGRQPSLLRVRDHAEGFTVDDLDRKVGRMGEATSGVGGGLPVRGIWGDGLKEACLGLGVGGTVTSVRDGLEVSGWLRWSERGEPMYGRRAEHRTVDDERRRALGIPGDGAVVEVQISPTVVISHHDTLARRLSLHYALRDILRDPAREVILLRRSGERVTYEETIRFREPLAEPGSEVVEHGRLEAWGGVPYEVHLRRSEEPLSGSEEGPYRLGGLLVQSGRAVVDVTLFGHENRPGTEHLFGRVVCPALYARMLEGDLVLTRNRTGLNPENAFVRDLARAVDEHLQRWVTEEERRREVPSGVARSAPGTARLRGVVRQLNRILASELEPDPRPAPGHEASGERRHREPPEGDVAFDHPTRRVRVGHWSPLRLYVSADLLDGEGGDQADVRVEEGDLRVRRSADAFRDVPEHPHLRILSLEVLGEQVGGGAEVVVRVGEEEARTAVRVVARPERAGVEPEHGIRAIVFDERPDPEHRAVVREHDGALVIFVREPSLGRYLAVPEDRDGPVGRALTADLIAQALCRHVAILQGRDGDVRGAREAGLAMMRRYEGLVHTWAGTIHDALG